MADNKQGMKNESMLLLFTVIYLIAACLIADLYFINFIVGSLLLYLTARIFVNAKKAEKPVNTGIFTATAVNVYVFIDTIQLV